MSRAEGECRRLLTAGELENNRITIWATYISVVGSYCHVYYTRIRLGAARAEPFSTQSVQPACTSSVCLYNLVMWLAVEYFFGMWEHHGVSWLGDNGRSTAEPDLTIKRRCSTKRAVWKCHAPIAVLFSLVLSGFHCHESTLSLHRQKVYINLTTLPFKC